MRLWAEIWDGAQTTMLGLVALASATVVDTLDKAGSMALDVPATDPQATGLMRWGRWAYVYTDTPRLRRVGKGLLMRHNISISGGQKTVSWKCTDSLVDLQRRTTLNARIYDDVPIGDVVRDLVDLVPGWSVKLDGVAGRTSRRYDGVTVLEAITDLAMLHGYHFRVGADRQLVFGELGEDSGVMLVGAGYSGLEMRANMEIALIENLMVQEDGAMVVNWLVPFSGPVDGALTLRRSTRTLPYPIETMTGPSGETIYFIRHPESIAAYGQIELTEGPRDLVFPVSDDEVGLINAANVLYDWAATQLDRRSRPQRNYTGMVAKLDTTSVVGKQIHLRYTGEAATPNRSLALIDVDEMLWVTEQTARYSLAGVSVDVALSNNSEPPRRPEQMIARLLKQQRQQVAQMHVAQRTFKDTLTFAGYGDSQTLDFEVSDEAVDITACRLKVTRLDAATGPDRLTVSIDGVDVPGGLFLNGAVDGLVAMIDISDAIRSLPVVRGEHVLTIRALYGTGDLAVNMALYEALVGLHA